MGSRNCFIFDLLFFSLLVVVRDIVVCSCRSCCCGGGGGGEMDCVVMDTRLRDADGGNYFFIDLLRGATEEYVLLL